jgi:hypothetical protein
MFDLMCLKNNSWISFVYWDPLYLIIISSVDIPGVIGSELVALGVRPYKSSSCDASLLRLASFFNEL